MKKIAVNTGGGDAPGLNAVIRGVAARAAESGHDVVGFRNGWEGLMDGTAVPLDRAAVRTY